MAYIKRAAEDTIARVSKMFPVLLVTGPRQVGKTTLLQRLADIQKSEGIERKYVTLDDPDVRYLAKHDPALFLQRYSPPVLIDEIQYATELLPYIKMSVDRSKRKGDFWITGSQVFRLMKNVSESLAGRVGIFATGRLVTGRKKRASGRSALSADGRIHKNQSTECD